MQIHLLMMILGLRNINMGCGSQLFCIIFFTAFLCITIQRTHILLVDASFNAEEHSINGYEPQDNHVQKVAGEDESEEKKALILEKFRALLGLKSFHGQSPHTGDIDRESPSPCPSPAMEAAAPVPAPAPHTHFHSHHPIHRFPIPQPNKEDRHNSSTVKRILVAVLVSSVFIFMLSVMGLIWFCQRFKKERKRTISTVSTYSMEGAGTGGAKWMGSQNLTKKVSHQGLDLFYIDSLETALEPQPFVLKQSSNESTSKRKDELSKELRRSDSDRRNSSADAEIISIHESVESVKYESDGWKSSSGKKMGPSEAHSSDDESFHSLCGSHSSGARLSHASAGSFSEEPSEILSSKDFKVSLCSVNTPLETKFPSKNPESSPHHDEYNQKQNAPIGLCSSNCQKSFTPPPPPPLPPPPLPSSRLHVSSYHSIFHSARNTSKALSSSTSACLSPPRSSDSSSSGSKQTTPESDVLPSTTTHNSFKSLVGTPPPPCPPPFLKRSNNFPRGGPPPPPSQPPPFTPMGKHESQLPKLKPLHWDKVRAAPHRSTVWDKLRWSSFELDEEMIESLFGYHLQESIKGDEAKGTSPNTRKHVLEPKRLQNITILSKALNATTEHVCDALMKGEGLSLQQLEALVKMTLTREEEGKLSSYEGDVNELSSAEKFVKTMLNIPCAFQRIEAMLYKETFDDEVVHLRNSFSMLQEACQELRSSRLFLKLLEAVLKTGNRMNVGTIRGGAKAFKLDALLKLADVKGTDGRTTLLHFVVQEIVKSEGIKVSESIMGKITQKSKGKNAEEKEDDYRRMGLDLVSSLSIELHNVKKTATIDLDVLASSLLNLSDGMSKLHNLVQENLGKDEESRRFVQLMRAFLSHAEKHTRELREDESRVQLGVREITEYFHGDVNKDEANPLRIFVIVRDFLGMLDHVCRELRCSKVPNSPFQ